MAYVPVHTGQFKKLASENKEGYQTLINSALRDYRQGH